MSLIGSEIRPAKAAEEQALLLLASGVSVTEAARQCGKSRRTLSRWLAKRDFRKRLNAVRAELFERGLGILAASQESAARTLTNLLASETDTVRLGASRLIIELGAKLREAVELEARIAALELRESR